MIVFFNVRPQKIYAAGKEINDGEFNYFEKFGKYSDGRGIGCAE
jgi:hypothetical protein